MGVFEDLTRGDPQDLNKYYIERISDVHEYDAREIQDFLLTSLTDNLRDTLYSLRNELFIKTVEDMPQLSNGELYNRQKNNKFAEDIYTLGNCIVNSTVDSRVYKILKLQTHNRMLSSQAQLNSTDEISNVTSEITELIGVGLDFKNTVNDLKKVIADLKTEIQELRNEVSNLKSRNTDRLDEGNRDIEALENDDHTHVQDSESNADTNQADTRNEEHQPNTILINTASNPAEDSHPSTSNAPNQMNTSSQQRQNQGFQLPRSQRSSAVKGQRFTAKVQRPEICGASTSAMFIKGTEPHQPPSTFDTELNQPRSIYVGRLAPDVTTEKLRRHLQSNNISRVSDIIKLNCRNPEQSSFCVIVDDETTETALFDPLKWPKNTRVRQYTPNKNAKKANNTTGKQSTRYDWRKPQNQQPPTRRQSPEQMPVAQPWAVNVAPPRIVSPYFPPVQQSAVASHQPIQGNASVFSMNPYYPLRDANLWIPAY